MTADLSTLERVIGREALESLIKTCGGLEIRIPKTLPKQGPLADLPLPAQEALIRYAGGDVLYVPKAEHLRVRRRNEAIRKAYDVGERVQDLARQYNLSERWIYNILGRSDEAV
jgi:hypothetical protein